jgi:uncharacterized protein involved in cysteine biosynthesis
MSDQIPSSSIDLLAIVKYLWMVIAAVFAWIFRDHLAEDKERARQLALVQQTYATRDDISDLHQKIDENHREVMRVLTRD